MSAKQQPSKQQPAKNEAQGDPGVIYERVKAAADLHALRIQEHDKRMEEHTKKVDEGSKFFGTEMRWGMAIGLLGLFIALYYSISPIVTAAASKIDWDARMKVAVDEQLKERLTKDVLAKAISDEQIQKAASAVADSPAFKADIRKAAEDAARKAVTVNVDKIIADTNNFRAVIEEQMRAEQDRLRAATATTIPITADKRDDLSKKLLEIVAGAEKLGKDINIDVYPFDDVLHIRATINWQAEQPESERVRLSSLAFEGLGATTEARKKTVAEYVGQPSVPARVGVMRAGPQAKKRFMSGQFYGGEASKHSNYQSASEAVVSNSLELIEDCFGIEFPTTWRVHI